MQTSSNLKRENRGMYDLHGLSVEQAKMRVLLALQERSFHNITQIRFVTGRGNHVNARGERGTLFRDFPHWLQQTPLADSIERCDVGAGHYDVYFKTTTPQEDARCHQALRSFLETMMLPGIIRAAKSGDAYSQAIYGEMLLHGQGESVRKNVKQAFKYLRLSAKQNDPRGWHSLAECYFHGKGVRQSDSEAIMCLQKAHELGILEATGTLAQLYPQGLHQGLTPEQIFDFQLEAANRGVVYAMRYVGSHFHQNGQTPADQKNAFYWYKKAADIGDTTAQYNIAIYYLRGTGTPIDKAQAVNYMSKAARAGDPEARFMMHKFYSKGLGTACEPNAAKADKWLKRAAQAGSAEANHKLADIASKTGEHQEYLQRASAGGNLYATLTLMGSTDYRQLPKRTVLDTYETLSENQIRFLPEEAKHLLLDLTYCYGKKKHKVSVYNIWVGLSREDVPSSSSYTLRRLAQFYLHGDGCLSIKKNIETYLTLMCQAVALGDPAAMFDLALLLAEGQTTQQNTEALALITQAAQQHHYPKALYFLAKMDHATQTHELQQQTIKKIDYKTILFNLCLADLLLRVTIEKSAPLPLDEFYFKSDETLRHECETHLSAEEIAAVEESVSRYIEAPPQVRSHRARQDKGKAEATEATPASAKPAASRYLGLRTGFFTPSPDKGKADVVDTSPAQVQPIAPRLPGLAAGFLALQQSANHRREATGTERTELSNSSSYGVWSLCVIA